MQSGFNHYNIDSFIEEVKDPTCITQDLSNIQISCQERKENQEKIYNISENITKLDSEVDEESHLVLNKYLKKPKSFEIDTKKLNEDLGSKKSKKIELEQYFNDTNLDKLIEEANQINEEINSENQSVLNQQNVIIEKNDAIANLWQQIPEELQNTDIKSKIKIQNDKKSLTNQKIAGFQSKNDQLFVQFKESTKNYSEISEDLIENKDWDEITKEIQNSIDKVKSQKTKEEKKIPEIKLKKGEVFQTKLEELYNSYQNEVGENNNIKKTNEEELQKYQNDKVKIKIIEANQNKLLSNLENFNYLTENIKVYSKAKEICEEALKSISQKVLPQTINNLTKILPILTADRYKDAKVTEDYKILLFDSETRRLCR